MHTMHELSAQGKSIHAIARELGIARNTVRRYLRGKPEAVPRPKRDSLLDPHKTQIQRWIQEDHLYNCETMLERLREQGYIGNGTIRRRVCASFSSAQRWSSASDALGNEAWGTDAIGLGRSPLRAERERS